MRSENREYDISREAILKDFQIEILRFTHDEVIKDTSHVIERIKSTIEIVKQKVALEPNKGKIAG